MRTAKIAVWMVLLAALVLAVAIASLPAYLEGHRDLLAAGASQALGRAVEIGGPVTLSWSFRPSIQVDDVRIGNPGWAPDRQFVHADHVRLRFDLGALLRRRVQVTRLSVRGGEIRLKTSAQGENNWTFGSGQEGPIGFAIDAIEAQDLRLLFQPVQGTAQSIGIARLNLSGLGGPTPTLDAEASYAGIPLSVSASAGGDGGQHTQGWPFKVRVQGAEAELEVAGSAGGPFDAGNLAADLAFHGNDLRSFCALAGRDWLPEGPFRIALHLTRDAAGLRASGLAGALDSPAPLGPIRVSGGQASLAADKSLAAYIEGSWRQSPASLKLELAGTDPNASDSPRRLRGAVRLGETVLTTDLRMVLGGQRPRLAGELRFARLDLNSLLRTTGPQPVPGPAVDGGPVHAWDQWPLPAPALRSFDANLGLHADRVAAGAMEIERFRARLSLTDGRLRLDGLGAALPGLTLTGRVTADTRSESPVLEAELKAERIELPAALSFLADSPKLKGSLQSVALKAQARGETLRAMLDTLGGELSARGARLVSSGAPGGAASEVRLTRPRLTVLPRQPVRLRTALTAGQQTFDLNLTGGPLGDLLSDDTPWPIVAFVASGKLNGAQLQVRGDMGPLASLLAWRDLGVDLSGRWQGMEASVRGTFARLDALSGSRLEVTASGKNLSPLGTFLGAAIPQASPFTLSARLEGRDGWLDLRELKATSGDSDLAGELRLRLGPKLRVEGTLTSRLIDLAPYLGGGKGESRWSEPLPFEKLHLLDGAVDLDAGHVRLGTFGRDDANLHAALDSGQLRLALGADRDRFSADLVLKPEQTQWTLSVEQRGKLDLARLMEGGQARALWRLPASLDLRLRGAGGSLEAMLGAADGQVEVVLGAGRLNRKAAAFPLSRVLTALLDTVNPANLTQPFDDLQCAVLQFDVAKGIATSTRGLAVQTRTLNIIGSGAINLRNREIELRFKTVRRRGIGIGLLGIADRFVHIKGTLDKPRAAIDPAGLIVHGGAAWATSGMGLLYGQLAKRLSASADPCEAVMPKDDRQDR
jgi:uncharacterized protein involved in outer membrane biogenesis